MPASAPHGPAGEALYPGICRRSGPTSERRGGAGEPFALRLDVGRALALTGPLPGTTCAPGGSRAARALGDVVLARKDVPSSYHLAVTVDDAASRG